ncbi:MAG: hypothetical protein V4497_09955 [Bacteroidota bacterium]
MELRFNNYKCSYKHYAPKELNASYDLSLIKPQSGGMFIEIQVWSQLRAP